VLITIRGGGRGLEPPPPLPPTPTDFLYVSRPLLMYQVFAIVVYWSGTQSKRTSNRSIDRSCVCVFAIWQPGARVRLPSAAVRHQFRFRLPVFYISAAYNSRYLQISLLLVQDCKSPIMSVSYKTVYSFINCGPFYFRCT
jgi:hypothetical protein